MDILNKVEDLKRTLNGHPYGVEIAFAIINGSDHIVLTFDNLRNVQFIRGLFNRISIDVKTKRSLFLFKRRFYKIKCYFL